MSGRFLLLGPIVPITAMLVAGCDEYDGRYYGYSANEIVFGIRQSVDPTSAETSVSASYEYLGLMDKGGWATSVFRDGDGEGTCYFERYGNRLGHPHVESGVATWTGGKLPATGLQVLANQPDPTKVVGAGWAADDILTFDVSGFAMPRLQTVNMYAPRTALEITAISPAPVEGASETSIASTNDVGVSWTPTTRDGLGRVMVTLETDEEGSPGAGVRCFGLSTSGSVVIPARWVARLFSSVEPDKPIKGRIAVASHRQVTYHARGSWTAYIVATTLHREQPFAGVR